jgi:VWFA-related protein
MKALAVLTACLLLAAQQQEPQPPRTTFRSAVDLVPVDVNVLDKTGRPVSDLTAEDFTLTVDGRPRRIASAQFISVQRALESAPPKPIEYSSNSGAAGGRLVMIVVDSGNIGIGRGKPAIEAAQRFVGGLNRADRVALVTIPGSGPQLEFTSNHALIQTLLNNIVGQATNRPGPQRVGLSEALNIKRNDQSTIADVADRECGADPTTASREACLSVLNNDSDLLISEARERTRNSMIALRHLFDRVATNETPKTLVFLSEGLLLDREQADVAWVGPAAAASHITFYVLQLDSPELEARAGRTSPSRGDDREVLRQGLDKLAGMAKGDVFRIVANPDFAFQRLALELSGYYLLSFEPEQGDRDGKPHRIKIDVRRSDLLLRARREFTVGAPIMRTTADTVIDTLRAPLLTADIPLKVTTYTFQDPDSPKLKIIVAADIDRSLNANAPISLGYLVLDNKGNVVTSQLEPQLTAAIDPRTRTQKYIGAALTSPGIYTLRMAVVDGDGKRGSVERSFTAKINGFGQLHVTDLLIADDTRSSAGALPPAVAADFAGDELHGYIELFSDVPERLRDATVVIEIAQNESGNALDSVPARFQDVASANRRVAEAGVPIANLPEGEYVARAVVLDAGRRIGTVLRPFRIARTTAPVAAPGTTALAAAAPIPFVSKTESFDRFSVLTPPVVSFFLERFSAQAAASAATIRPAFAYIRAGRYEDAIQAVQEATGPQVAASFVRGLALLNRGEIERATARFDEAVKADPQFSAAAFYLGAAHAAAGNDRDAAAIWQKSLITDPSAPFVYVVLGDALLRMRDLDRAIDVFTEARALWPANDTVTQRMAATLVTANKPLDAMKVLDPYLAAHPADHERLLLALRALYEARSAGRVISSPEGDKALFRKYADAYVAAGGTQQSLVQQWRQVIER